jgi:hypothetical protein
MDHVPILEDANTLFHHTCYKDEKINISINEVPQDGDYDSDTCLQHRSKLANEYPDSKYFDFYGLQL